jgi:hypothetical protein
MKYTDTASINRPTANATPSINIMIFPFTHLWTASERSSDHHIGRRASTGAVFNSLNSSKEIRVAAAAEGAHTAGACVLAASWAHKEKFNGLSTERA